MPVSMQAANRLFGALRAGNGPTLGVWQMLPGANHARILARGGYDWICVDTEHGNIDDAAMHDAVGAIASCGVSPIVRIAADEGWMVKRALDAGAHGIVVPLLRTVEQARKIVQAAKFPPLGVRGFGSPFSMEKFENLTMEEYFKQANESLLTIVQIETREALESIDEIARVPGVDVLFIGPFDLGINIGFPIQGGVMAPELLAAIAKILKTGKAHKKPVAIYAVNGDQAAQFAAQGFDMISVVNDVGALQMYLSTALATTRAA